MSKGYKVTPALLGAVQLKSYCLCCDERSARSALTPSRAVELLPLVIQIPLKSTRDFNDSWSGSRITWKKELAQPSFTFYLHILKSQESNTEIELGPCSGLLWADNLVVVTTYLHQLQTQQVL